MIDSLRPFLSRFIAPFITGALAWLALKLGVTFGADTPTHITEFVVVVIVGLMQLVNGMIHKTIDKKVNPVDAASKPIAVAGKVESERGVT